MPGRRIDFPKDDAAKFNELRDRWTDAAAGGALPRIAIRVASVLPRFVNRDLGYAFPTDLELAERISTSTRNIGKGMTALENAFLIERETRVKRDEKGEAIGRLRRVYLTMPGRVSKIGETPNASERKRAETPRGERNTLSEVNGTEVNGTPEVNGTKRVGERNDGVPNIPDRYTPDTEIRRDHGKVGVYARDDADRSPEPFRSPPRPNPFPSPPSWGSDIAFLDEFDRLVRERTAGKEIGAGEIETITQEAFDATTDSTDDFMPVHWREILALRSQNIAEWFRWRASSIAHERMREAA